MKRKLTYLAAALTLTGLAACSAPSTKVMTDSGEKITLSPEQTLQAFHWNLINTVKADGTSEPAWSAKDSSPIRLTFLDNLVAVQGLCNNLNAGYQLNNSAINFSQGAATMRMCNDQELMQYEREVAQLLPTATRWSLAAADQSQRDAPAPVLTIHFENGDAWRLSGKQTNETKYGSAAETVFLEVAPQTEVCPQSGNNCLKVRQVIYDANAIQTGVGEWVLFQPNSIEGFNHQPGIATIIRTKRYTVKNPSATAADQAYVLDMVVRQANSN